MHKIGQLYAQFATAEPETHRQMINSAEAMLDGRELALHWAR
jgi:hypothetical protein